MSDETTAIVKAGEYDVLLGRGKQISEWSGNVHFRQVVNKFRVEYVTANRDSKVSIANRVIAIIHKDGGRFLQETEPGSGDYYSISQARAVEKCCQALREKQILNPPQGYPLSKLTKRREISGRGGNNSSKKIKASSVIAGVKKSKKTSPVTLKLPVKKPKRKYARKTSSVVLSEGSKKSPDSKEDMSKSQMSPVRSLFPKKADAKVNVTENNKEIEKDPCIPLQKEILLLMESPMDRLKRLTAKEMLNRLDIFIQEYRHAAVPPGWPRDPDLADWCTIRRQHLRIAKTGYAELSSEETELLKSLNSLNFVWDYDEWLKSHRARPR
jgi:hypothetical protein